MFKVDNFLGCAKLETGALIIGWYVFVTNILFLIMLLIGLIVLCIFGCEDLEKMLIEHHETIPENFREICGLARGVIIGILVVVMILCAAMIYISNLCIKGTKNRIHGNIKPLMIVMAVASIMLFLNTCILTFHSSVFVSSLIYGLIYGYAFVVLYSLFTIFRDENERGFNPQYHQPGSKV